LEDFRSPVSPRSQEDVCRNTVADTGLNRRYACAMLLREAKELCKTEARAKRILWNTHTGITDSHTDILSEGPASRLPSTSASQLPVLRDLPRRSAIGPV
jgi:hypothetical protein